ncbi:MAG TPA: hypothetical protein VHB48_10575, partial [Chitinophagaceae bacterium]|nr:hypothetical protein [Chitinophagaceae bacterium]
ILGIIVVITTLILYVDHLPTVQEKNIFSTVAGNLCLLVIIIAIIIGGIWKKVSIFDTFIEGAKTGFDIVLKIIPYLVGMLVAIRVFRDCGALTYLTDGIGYIIAALGLNTDFVPALPTAIMKPFSGGGSRALMIEAMKSPLYGGPDGFVGKLACTFMGSADATFYIFALYFGSVGIKKIRYAVWTSIMADIVGIIAAIVIAYIFFQRP